MFGILMMSLANAELTLWQDTKIDTSNNLVKHISVYELDDNSANGMPSLSDSGARGVISFNVGNPVPLQIIYSHQTLPYNITQYYPQYSNAYVDWCNYTTRFYKNNYDVDFNYSVFTMSGGFYPRIINTTIIINSSFYNSSVPHTTSDIFSLRAFDTLSVEVSCHYTNASTLFIENFYLGMSSVDMPSYSCNKCEAKTFEQLTQSNDKLEDRISQEDGLYTKLQNLTDKNYQLWIIFSWFIKISLVIVAIGLVFVPMYYVYLMVKAMGEKAR